MKYAELKKHISGKDFSPAYYFTGSDEYLKSWSLKMFKDVTDNADMNYTAFESPDDAGLAGALESFPIMGDLRIVVADVFPSDFPRLSAYFKSPSKTSVLIVLSFPEPRSAKKKQELEQLKKSFTEIDCNPLGRDMLMKWIATEAAKSGCEISLPAAELLIEYTKSDLSRINGELRKLVSYRDGEGISPEDVRALVAPGEEYKIWELSAAVADKDRAKAMQIADKFEEDKTEFVVMFGAVYKHFHNMFFVLCSDEDEAVRGLELYQGNYNRLLAGAKKFGTRKLKNIIYALGEVDLASKSGRLDKAFAARTMITAIIDAL